MELLDLRAKEYKILFDKGTSIAFTLLYLGADQSIIDLTGHTAHLKAWPEKSPATTPSLTLDSPSANLSLTTGDALLDTGVTLPGVHGVSVLLPDEMTAGFNWEGANFLITLENPNGDVLPFVKGVLCSG